MVRTTVSSDHLIELVTHYPFRRPKTSVRKVMRDAVDFAQSDGLARPSRRRGRFTAHNGHQGGALARPVKGDLQSFPAVECPVNTSGAHRVSVMWQCAMQLLGILSFRLVTPRMIRKPSRRTTRLCRPTTTRAAGRLNPFVPVALVGWEQTMGLVHGAAYSGVWRMA
jgi:hypothetical protein